MACEHIEAARPPGNRDKIIYDFYHQARGKPNFVGLYGLPARLISLNDVIRFCVSTPGHSPGRHRHIDTGNKSDRRIQTARHARALCGGQGRSQAQRLMDVTKASLYKGIEQAILGQTALATSARLSRPTARTPVSRWCGSSPRHRCEAARGPRKAQLWPRRPRPACLVPA